MMSLYAMRYLILALTIYYVAAASLPRSSETPAGFPPNYTLVELEWTGSFVPGGTNITLYGTVESVTAQVQALYPNLTSLTSNKSSGPLAGHADSNDGFDAALAPRDPGPLTCNIPWYGGQGIGSILEQGVAYLEAKQNIYCHLGPGPNICTRVSCSWNSGIFFCNDNTYDVWVLCQVFGLYAQNIINACQLIDGRVLGRQNDTYNFYVVAGGGNDGNGQSC